MKRSEEGDIRLEQIGIPPALERADQFSDEGPSEEEAALLRWDRGPENTGQDSITVQVRMSRSGAGWVRRPTSREFYEAIRTEKPTNRQKAIIGIFASEAEADELIRAWAEGAYTLRQLAAAIHRAGYTRCYAARVMNRWILRPEEAEG